MQNIFSLLIHSLFLPIFAQLSSILCRPIPARQDSFQENNWARSKREFACDGIAQNPVPSLNDGMIRYQQLG